MQCNFLGKCVYIYTTLMTKNLNETATMYHLQQPPEKPDFTFTQKLYWGPNQKDKLMTNFKERKKEKARKQYIELVGNGVLLVWRSNNDRTGGRPLTQPRKGVVRSQPWIPIKRQPFHLYFHFNYAIQPNVYIKINKIK